MRVGVRVSLEGEAEAADDVRVRVRFTYMVGLAVALPAGVAQRGAQEQGAGRQ